MAAQVKHEAAPVEAPSFQGDRLKDYEFAAEGSEYTPEHAKLRAERQARRDELKRYRQRADELPISKDFGNPHFEIPGR